MLGGRSASAAQVDSVVDLVAATLGGAAPPFARPGSGPGPILRVTEVLAAATVVVSFALFLGSRRQENRWSADREVALRGALLARDGSARLPGLLRDPA